MVVDQTKANVILSVLKANNSGPGFQNVTWLRPRTNVLQMWKHDLKRGTCISSPGDGWQSEWTKSNGASSISSYQQTKTECLSGSCALAKHATELCMGTTVKYNDSWYSQDTQDDVKPPSSYELWFEETQIVYWISQISEWPLETTRALICMCNRTITCSN